MSETNIFDGQKKQQKNHTQAQTHIMDDKPVSQIASTQQSDIKPTFLSKFMTSICPCLSFYFKSNTLNSNQHEETKENIHTEVSPKNNFLLNLKKNSDASIQTLGYEPNKGKNQKIPLHSSLQEEPHKIQDDENVSKSINQKWQNYPVYQYNQETFLILGKDNNKMLAKIFTVKIQPSIDANYLTNKSKKTQQRRSNTYISNLDKYWSKRYFLFERFDEGISMNEQAWPRTIPQAVSEYIASKIKCETVLNAFCGVGGDAIKLAHSCNKVIATDTCESNLKSIYFNAKIYSVQNIIISNQNDVHNQIEPNVILISNYSRIEEDCLNNQSISPMNLKPSMKVIINKILNYSKNIVLVLPANIDIDELSQIFAQEIMQQKLLVETCSLKFQKIFYSSQLKYLVVYFGVRINNQITMNDQLQWMYDCINDEPKKVFPHKKFIKKLREMYGMVKLLNILLQAKQVPQKGTIFEKLCLFIVAKNLLSEEKLEKIIEEEKNEMKKNQKGNITKQKQNEEQQEQSQDENEIERTVSYFSQTHTNPSGQNRVSIDLRETDMEFDPYKSMVLRSSAPGCSLVKSFGTPYIEEKKKQQQEQSNPQQSSQAIQFYKLS